MSTTTLQLVNNCPLVWMTSCNSAQQWHESGVHALPIQKICFCDANLEPIEPMRPLVCLHADMIYDKHGIKSIIILHCMISEL
jgi:hypothetical protein